MGILLVLCLALVSPLAAQEERAISNFAGVGVRAMGMGGAYVGVADDFTAVFWNPAGLAQITERQLHMSFQSNSFESESLKDGTPSSSDLSNTRFGSLGVVFPYPHVARGSLVFAAGFNRIKDFDRIARFQTAATNDGQDETEVITDTDDIFPNEGELSALSLAAAVDVSPTTSLGLSINRISGENEAVNSFNDVDNLNLYSERRWTIHQNFTDDYKGAWNAILGALVRFPRESPRIRLGATVGTGPSHKIEYVFKGLSDPDAYNQIEYDDNTLEETPREEEKDSYKLSLPLEFGIGASFQPHESVLVSGSAHFAAWSQAEYDDEIGSDSRFAASFEDQYKDQTRYHMGVEWLVPFIALDLRAGYYTDPLPFVGPRDPNLSVSADNPLIVINQDRRFLTLGAGLLFDEVVQLNVAWNRGGFEQREGDESEDNTINRLLVGVSYGF
jgi:long-subunit fatty acid transport protein